MIIEPIAYIKTDFSDKFGVPRQSGRVKELYGKIVFEEKYRNEDALRGIEEFSHLWLIFDFSRSHGTKFSPTVRPPRLGGNKRVGVFASRSPFRPNGIGLSCVKLEKIEKSDEGTVLIVSGVDIIDNTPIYDIKPYIPYADCVENARGSYAQENADYFLEVDFPKELLSLVPENKRQALIGCLSEDPRPSYHDDEQRIYAMKFSQLDIKFKVCGDKLSVIDVS